MGKKTDSAFTIGVIALVAVIILSKGKIFSSQSSIYSFSSPNVIFFEPLNKNLYIPSSTAKYQYSLDDSVNTLAYLPLSMTAIHLSRKQSLRARR